MAGSRAKINEMLPSYFLLLQSCATFLVRSHRGVLPARRITLLLLTPARILCSDLYCLASLICAPGCASLSDLAERGGTFLA